MKDELPDSLRRLWHDLHSEVVWLHARWKLYRQLYGNSEKRIQLLNKTAAHFFRTLQLVLVDDALLGLSRLTDPPGKGNQENAVLEQILLHESVQAKPELLEELTKQLDTLKNACEPFRKVRNKRIAHRDLKTALAEDASPLPDTTFQMIQDALSNLRRFMETFELHFLGHITIYDNLASSSDAKALIAYLRLGTAYEEAEQARIIPWDHYRKTEFHDA